MNRAAAFILTAAVIAGIAFGFALTPGVREGKTCPRLLSAAVLFF